MDSEIKVLLDLYIDKFLNKDIVKKYFALEKAINNSSELNSLQNEMKEYQKKVALSLNNKEEYIKNKQHLINIQKEFYENPLVVNYHLLQEEIYEKLKTLQEELK